MGCGSHTKKQTALPSESESNLIPPDNIVPVSEPPVQVKTVNPEYPIGALKDGVTGTVWLQVYIDTLGNVSNPTVIKDSGKNAGFEEAAIEAALKTRWKPAIYDGRPVAVKVTYKVDFNLK